MNFRYTLLAIGLLLAMMRILVACAASQEQLNAAADSSYAADQADCVRISSTREDADKCRAARRSMWKVDAGMVVTEAGVK